MATQAGTVSELYLEPDGSDRGISAPPPPSAPAPIPPPAPQVAKLEGPVVTKRRMADETPDGRMRDTSTEALRDGNDLGVRTFDPDPKPEGDTASSAAPPAAVPAAEPPKPEAPPKLYAGKFKSTEELERGYEEAQKLITKQGQEAAELRKQTAQPKAPEIPKTPQQIASDEERKNQFLAEFVKDPEKVIGEVQNRAVQQTQVALQTQQMRADWIKANPDLAELEKFVAVEVASLIQTDPELAGNPNALLQKATDNFRQITGKIRTEAAKEALTTETRVIPLVTQSAPATATEQPAKAPLTADDAYALHMRMLKDQERKSHRGLRP